MPTVQKFQPKFRLSPDHVDLIVSLNAHGVRYLLVGGYAVGAYTEARATKDLDIYVWSSPENGLAVFRALATFGAPLDGITAEDFSDPKTIYQMGLPPERVDILKTLSGVTFEECWDTRAVGLANEEVEVPVISWEKLVLNKTAAGRPRDKADLHDMHRAIRLTAGKIEQAGRAAKH